MKNINLDKDFVIPLLMQAIAIEDYFLNIESSNGEMCTIPEASNENSQASL